VKVVYAKQPFPEEWTSAIFLAGPTPRDPQTPSWRPDALKLLDEMGYDGVVMVPEDAEGEWGSGPEAYMNQVDWERKGLDLADVILFWVPREMERMPALTTNVEFGRYVTSDKIIFGAPEWAKSVRYLESMLKTETGGQRHLDLKGTIQAALSHIASFTVSPRSGGERAVPLHIWTLPSFQNWYKAQTAVGNRLDDAKLLWHFRMPKAKVVFSFVLWVKVWIAAENRHKENEFVFTRTDISTVVLYHWPPNLFDGLTGITAAEIILVREFRSPARTPDGFIHELPGGSSLPEKTIRDLTFQDAARPPSRPHHLDGNFLSSEQAMVVRAQEDDVVHHVGASFGSIDDVAHVTGVLSPATQSTLGSEVEPSNIPEGVRAGVMPVRGPRSKHLSTLPHTETGSGAGDGVWSHGQFEGERLPADSADTRGESRTPVRRFDSLVESPTLSPTKNGGADLPRGARDGVSAVAAGFRGHGFATGPRTGSSTRPVSDDYRQVASSEVHEETGLIISADRFQSFGSRQVAGTLSTHHAHLFAAELTQEEMAQAKLLAKNNEVNGVEEDSERTYVEVTTVAEMLANPNADWSVVGMVLQAVLA